MATCIRNVGITKGPNNRLHFTSLRAENYAKRSQRKDMFDHPDFDVYPIDNIPLHTDLYLRDERDMAAHEKAMLDSFEKKEWKPAGPVSFVAARHVAQDTVELDMFVNIYDRYHRVSVSLPRSHIRCCVGSSAWDEKPSIFVDGDWLERIHCRVKCVFGLIDADGIRSALRRGLDMGSHLEELRVAIDEVAARFPQVLFLSFADSVVLKSQWTSGYYKKKFRYSYDPESMLVIFGEIRKLFQRILGCRVYGVFTQGDNLYHDTSLHHISKAGNHVCLNSLGAPFADLKAIEDAARKRIRTNEHGKHDLYLDESFMFSLKLHGGGDLRVRPRHGYTQTLSGVQALYVCASYEEVARPMSVECAGKT
jgi:hypothetical protein